MLVTETDKLPLLRWVKRQIFCVGDRLKMNKHNAWNNNSVVAPNSGRVNDNERTDEANFQCEFNGLSGRREQPISPNIRSYPVF